MREGAHRVRATRACENRARVEFAWVGQSEEEFPVGLHVVIE